MWMRDYFKAQALTVLVYRFNPRRKLELIPEHWQRVLHHVTIEVLALAQAGRDVSAVYTERPVRMEDWKRTKGVDVKVDNGKVELLLPTDDTLEQIVKAVPESLAEEIILAVENAEAIPEPVTEEELAEELAQESAEELAQEDVETATEIAAEESAEGLTKHYVDPKDIDAAEKTTMGQLRDAIKTTGRASKMVGQGKNRRSVAIPATNLGFLEVPLADPTIKLAVSLLRPHYTEAHTDTSTDPQACAAIDRPAHIRPRSLVCLNREQPLHGRQVQVRAR